MDLAFDLTAPCESCPFRTDIPPWGSDDWAADVLQMLDKRYLPHSHTCHRTDAKADGFNKAYEGPVQHCAGISILLKREHNTTAALLEGIKKAINNQQRCPGWDDLQMDAPIHTRESMQDLCIEIIHKAELPQGLHFCYQTGEWP